MSKAGSKGYSNKLKKPETFLVNLTVHEGRHYVWPNMNSYVHMKVGKQEAITKIRYGTDAPFYNEYFVFEYKMDLQKLLDYDVTITVYRSKSCCKFKKVLGYVRLDVRTVWAEPDHQFYRKWAILSSIKSGFGGPVGYLKVTISILGAGEKPKMPIVNPLSDNEIEGNLLLPEGATERKRALFIFKVYRGFDIVKKKHTTAVIEDDILEKDIKDKTILPDVGVMINFAGLVGKTTVKKKTAYPIWNESLTISELYPPLSEKIKIELVYQHKGHNAVQVKNYINLHSLCDYKNPEFLPTFGPAYVHFYKNIAMGEEYVGKILMALETKVFADAQTKTRTTFLDEVPPVFDTSLWQMEDIFLFTTIANVSVIDKRYVKDVISFELNWGRMQVLKNPETSTSVVPHIVTPNYKPLTRNKEFWYLDFGDVIPCMHIINHYPNLQRRMFRANQIDKIVTKMADQLTSVRNLFKSDVFISNSNAVEDKLIAYFDYVASACTKFTDMIKASDPTFETNLDKMRSNYILVEMTDIAKSCKEAYNARLKKKSFRTAEKFYLRMVKLMDYPQETWPNVYLWMRNGHRKTECLKFLARDIIFSKIPEKRGKYAGQLNNFYFMTNKYSKALSPVVCKIELFIWLGLERHRNDCFQLIPNGFRLPDAKANGDSDTVPKYLQLNDFIKFNCRVHIYQGRFTLAFDYTGLSDFFARVIIHDQSKHTQARKQTLNPIWDETLILKNILCYGTRAQIERQPPSIVLEVNDQDKWSLEYVGFCLITPIVKFAGEKYAPPKFPPILEWHQIIVDDNQVGEVLACAELLEATENEQEDILLLTDAPHKLPALIRPHLVTYRFEILIWGVRHLKKLNHMPIRQPKIVIECSEYKLESEVADISQLNFSHALQTLDMQLPQIQTYIPPLMIKLFNCKSLGRCIYAGTHLCSIQEFIYRPITLQEFRQRMTTPVRTSLESLPSKSESQVELEIAELKKEAERKKRKQHRRWKIRQFCSCGNFCGLCKTCLKGSWRGFKRTLRFICCLLLCCGCGRMFRKKKEKVKKDQAPPKFFRTKETVIDIDMTQEEHVKDWWSKYFNSLGDPYALVDNICDRNFKIKVYDNELENQSHYDFLRDVFDDYKIYRGKTTGDEHEDEKAQIGAVKCKIRAYLWEDGKELVTPQGKLLKDGFFQEVPSNDETAFVVRIYCVRGIKLRPTDSSGSSDSYIVIKMNHQVIDDKKNYIAKSANPFYGKCFELEGKFPKDNTLTVYVYDWDRHSKTDLIGQTRIDLENRFYSKHRAYCGLPFEYTLFGETPWRDNKEPTQILHDLCARNNLPAPIFSGGNDKITIAGKTFAKPIDKEREHEPDIVKKEMLALHVLHKWNEMPLVGYHLVPEHVETRSLYRPDTPGIEQGKLQMWIDIFPIGDTPTPHQVNIKTRAPVSYELRVIIWNTDSVVLNEDDFFGDRKSDIYVKGWITSPAEAQDTDVHYRSLTGEGNFNWRFVFVFDYLSAENMIVEKKRQTLFDIDETERKLPCRLTLQVWDNDIFSKDDFLGSLTLYLNRMPRGAKVSRQCSVRSFEEAPRFNLFKVKRTRGWWPFLTKQKNDPLKSVLSGKLEAEFELITSEQANIAPTGLGREAPQPLPPPKRPSTSFNWILNPWKTCRFIVWKGLKWKLLICSVIVLGGLFAGLFLYSVPGYSVKKLLSA